MVETKNPDAVMFHGVPPEWALGRPKPVWQSAWDFVGAPLRMILFPDHVSERWHLTSLRAERLGKVLPQIKGRCLDIGAGDNMLLRLYRERMAGTADARAADESVGADVFDWGGGCVILPDCRKLPFEDGSFDTVTFIACLNHIPEREDALREAFRVLRPGGRIIVTMIGRLLGIVGHAIWWYSEDKHREVAEGEVMGMDPREVDALLASAGFQDIRHQGFVYGLNRLTIASRP